MVLCGRECNEIDLNIYTHVYIYIRTHTHLQIFRVGKGGDPTEESETEGSAVTGFFFQSGRRDTEGISHNSCQYSFMLLGLINGMSMAISVGNYPILRHQWLVRVSAVPVPVVFQVCAEDR